MSTGTGESIGFEPYPLKFEPVLRETIWGGNRLEPLLGRGTSSRRIGEAWIIWDGLTVSNGPLRGYSLADIVKTHSASILGDIQATEQFPLLVKLIDARDNLSVQVHPDDQYARVKESQHFGKSEVWLVLDAEPGASVIHGVKHRVEPGEVASAVAAAELGDLMESVPVQAGDVIYNPAGTVHALGKGILIYELQQSSDITYRLYDWDRKQADGSSRELHVDKSIDVLTYEPFAQHKIQPVQLRAGGCERRFLCVCDYFAAESIWLTSGVAQSTQGRRFDIFTVLEGAAEVFPGKDEAVELRAGESVLLPAILGDYEVRPVGEQAVVVKAYVPDLREDVVAPLRQQGVSDADILQLGGDLLGNDLVKAMSQE